MTGRMPPAALLVVLAVFVAVGAAAGTLALVGSFGPPEGSPAAPTPRAVSPHPSRPAADGSGPVRLAECPRRGPGPAAPDEAGYRLARTVRPDATGPSAGIAYLRGADALVLPVASAEPDRPLDLAVVSILGQRLAGRRIPVPAVDPLAIAEDPDGRRIVALADGGRTLVEIATGPEGLPRPDPEAVTIRDATPLGLSRPAGLAIDGTGWLVVLDGAPERLVRLRIAPGRPIDPAAAARPGQACAAPLDESGGVGHVGLAVDPRTDHLFTLRSAEPRLDELTPEGDLVATRNLAALGLRGPSGLTIGPTGDPTDEPDRTSVYLLDVGERGAAGREVEIHELLLSGLVRPPVPVSDDVHGAIVAVHPTSRWTRTSPDPSGIAYDPLHDRLVVTDAEVDETAHFARANVFFAGRDGRQLGTALAGFTPEPSDLAIDPTAGRWFVSDDLRRRIYVVELGADGEFGTTDDRIATIDTTRFGSLDPEGIAVAEGSLYIADGLAAEIYRLRPGPNGRFDGVAPDGDDLVDRFDTLRLGQPNPEGVAYRPSAGTLLVVSNDRTSNLLEVSLTGELVRIVDLSFLGALAPAGLAVAPGSDGRGESVFIADRGVDNAADPDENDGQIHELRILAGPPPNLLGNPGFEVDADRDSRPDRWATSRPGRLTREPTRGGEAALELPVDGSTYSVAQTFALLSTDRSYSIAGWVHVAGLRGSPRLAVRVRWLNAAGGTIVTAKVAEYTTDPGDWDRFVARVEAPPGAVTARLVLAVGGGSGGRFVVDDLLVQP